MKAGLVARIRASESPALWRAAAAGCRGARLLSRHRSRWSSRLGYALERLDRARDTRLERATRGTPAAAQASLAEQAEQQGDLAAAVQAWQRAVELGGAADPRWRVRLADLYGRVGQWAMAGKVLRHNIAAHPRHALSHRRLGEIGQTLAQWGGSFTGTLEGRTPAWFAFDQPRPAATTAARQALERAAELEPAKTIWRSALAEARLADGDLAGAAALYETALRDAEQSTGRWVLAVKHRWQFALESIHHGMGRPRVEDPLFACTAEPAGTSGSADPVEIPGLFSVRIGFAGLAISGLVAAEDADHVQVLLDGVPLRDVNVGGDGFFPQFNLDLKRPTLAAFPPQAEIEVHTPGGAPLRAPGGGDRIRASVPHGSGQLGGIVAAGSRLGKKGVISPSVRETRLRQQRYLKIYATVRDFFEKELDRPLFLMYGTLLGYHRDGDFIPGDDDFDAGYASDETDPVAVKEETKRLIVELVRAGFTVSFNRKGRLFRIQLEREATDGFHLDLRPVWFQQGRVWVHNHCSFPATRDDFLPVVEGELRGERILAPRDTEAFLRGHYGPGWNVPDPGFMYYTSEIDPAILDNLARALITVREYHDLAARIRREVGDGPPAGRFVSVGWQDLYPLDEVLA